MQGQHRIAGEYCSQYWLEGTIYKKIELGFKAKELARQQLLSEWKSTMSVSIVLFENLYFNYWKPICYPIIVVNIQIFAALGNLP